MIANPSSSSGWPYCLCNCLPHQSYRSLYPVSRRALPAKMSRTICSRSLPLTTFKSRSLSLNNVNKGLVRALAESQVSDNVVTDSFPQPYSVKIPVGDRHVSLIASLSLYLFSSCNHYMWNAFSIFGQKWYWINTLSALVSNCDSLSICMLTEYFNGWHGQSVSLLTQCFMC